jgi:aminocarboxymuconate-semialdehyde decarboxylase
MLHNSLHKINAHGHLLPYPSEFPTFMKEKKVLWVDAAQTSMYQKNWSRPVTHPSFFLEEKLEWMAQHQLDHEVLITLSQLYCNGYSRRLTQDVVRFQNDYHAQIQANHREKFTAGFVLQPRYLNDALAEMERCVTKLNLTVLCLPTHFLDNEKKWCSVADERLFPLFELANYYGLALEIHPYDAEKMIALADSYWRFHLVWMMAQTADTYHFYTLLDFPRRFPNIRTCFAHANLFGNVNIGRRQQGFVGRPDLFPTATAPNQSIGHPNIYFDTLTHDADVLALILKKQGVSQLLVGLDDPYPLGEMETVPNSYPGKVLDDLLHSQQLHSSDIQMMWKDNVLRWLNSMDFK